MSLIPTSRRSRLSPTVNLNDVTEGGFSLSASGYKIKGRHTIDLTWSGATTIVNVHRDGALTAPNETNDGKYTDSTDFKGNGSYDYQVCETGGTTTCSNEATVTF